MNMKIVGRIAWLTLFLFCFFLFTSDGFGAPQKNRERIKDDAALSGSPESAGTLEKEEGEGKIEVTRPTPKSVQKKKFPWLIVAASVVVVAALLYFVVLNKKCTLTVNLGEGVQGTPAAGAAKYKKNEEVPYQYTLAPSYRDLAVKLDGAPVSASGSVKMDKSHTLEASATLGATINVTTNPAGAQIWLDGVKTVWRTPYVVSFEYAGSHTLLLRLDGYKDHAQTVQAVMGVETPLNVNLAAGHREDFDVEASGLWKPMSASEWKVAGGWHWLQCRMIGWNYNFIDHNWATPNFNVTTSFMQKFGTLMWPRGIILVTSTSGLPSVSGYAFTISQNGYYFILKLTNCNLTNLSGGISIIKNWTPHWSIAYGLNVWNTLKVARQGSSYSFYINGTLVATITDASHDPRFAGVMIDISDMNTEMYFDYFNVDI